MKTPRIEEIKKQKFYQYLQVAGFHKEVEDWLRQALIKAYQAGIDEAMEIVKENRRGAFTDEGGNNCWYVDELIKALQDNKE